MTPLSIALSALIVSVTTLLLTGLRDVRSRRRERFDLRQNFFSAAERWAAEVLQAMSRCATATQTRRPHGLDLADLRSHLSALIDQGRWYFPNVEHEEVGVHKDEAFRGYREEVLNHAVAVYRIVDGVFQGQANPTAEGQIVAAKRAFTSEMQRILDPRQRRREFLRLTGGP